MAFLNPAKIQKILVISLSNIGDVILTFPVLDILREDFPKAQISIVVGPKAESLLKYNPHFQHVFVFNKHQPFFKTMAMIWQLRKEHYDLTVDLRNTVIPLFLGCRYRTSLWGFKKRDRHMRAKHLNRLKTVYSFLSEPERKYSLFVSDKDRQYVNELLLQELGQDKPFIVLAPGAANGDKRWTSEGFQNIGDHLIKVNGMNIIFVGDEKDREITQNIQKKMTGPGVNLCGRLTLPQLGELFRKASLVISNDSAPMHLASYLNRPVLAIFGPSDPRQYGPWSAKSYFIRKNQTCPKCSDHRWDGRHTCMAAIQSEDILKVLNFNLQEFVSQE